MAEGICCDDGTEAAVDISITSPMLKAFQEGVPRYTPLFEGKPLEEEQGCSATTIRNLSVLLGAGLRVASFHVNAGRQVFILFVTGESYLATGFSTGERNDKVAALSKFAARAGFGDAAELFEIYATLPEEWTGELPSPDHEPTLFRVELPQDLSDGR